MTQPHEVYGKKVIFESAAISGTGCATIDQLCPTCIMTRNRYQGTGTLHKHTSLKVKAVNINVMFCLKNAAKHHTHLNDHLATDYSIRAYSQLMKQNLFYI